MLVLILVLLLANVLAITHLIYLLKVNSRNTRTRYEICSTLTIKTPEHCNYMFKVNNKGTRKTLVIS